VSTASAGWDITRTDVFREADIIHLHWVNQGLLSIKSIQKILQSGKPVVWTMHDMWPITSICHHSYECDKYQSECYECQFLKYPSISDLSVRIFRKKKYLYGNNKIYFVAVSKWLAEKASKSEIIRGQLVAVIPNAINIAHFNMIDRNDARSILQINNRYVLAYGAARIDDTIKGFEYLIKSLDLLVNKYGVGQENVHLLLFGGIKDKTVLKNIPVSYTYFGYVTDVRFLSKIYSASNIVVSSSLYETFGQTLIEAMCCGAIPVAFDGSGQQDIITHKENGYLAKRLSADSLAEGLLWAFRCNIHPKTLRYNVLKHFSENVVAAKYIKLYDKLGIKQL
jgi:glycosyltransferase involved in cell wall biosynthesis